MKTLKRLLFPKDMLLICCLLTWGWVRGRRGGGVRKGTPLPSVKVLILNQCTFADVFGLFSLLVRQK